MKAKLYFHIILILIWMTCAIQAGYAQKQEFDLSGTVKSTSGNPIPYATVRLENSPRGVLAGEDGNFTIKALKTGTYQVVISSVGFESIRKSINLQGDATLHFSLKESVSSLNEVQISVRQLKSTEEKIEEKSFTVNSIDTKQFENLSADLNNVLAQSTGVRIKESGGLGSTYNLSLNGLSDKQVRIFVDEIPVDQLGSGFSLNNIPVNLVERIDVYKGVVPVKLGADALGGAINIVTEQDANSYLDVSYNIGSFNTHRAALNSKYRSLSGFTVKASGFYNYSDNNYRMENMPVFVDGKEREIDIRRFHDQYKSYMGKAEAGFTKTNWADQLLAGISHASVDQDVQSGIYGKAVGEATETEQNTTYTLKYSKGNLINNKLGINLFSLYNTVKSTSIDTSSNRYDWSGQITRTENNSLGELVREKTIFEYNQSHFLYRGNLAYQITGVHQISLNHIHSKVIRKGENRLNKKDNEPFRSPNDIGKSVTGLEYELNLMEGKWLNIGAIKHYKLHMLTRNAIQYQQGDFEIEDITTDKGNWGFSLASRYFIKDDWYIKGSFEKGYRLPQPQEIFGNGLRVLANPKLKPESSLNTNLGMNYRIKLGSNVFRTGMNLFMRDVDNFIFIQQEGVFSRYRNVMNVLIRGLEWELSYQHGRKLDIQANLTWQNVLNNEKYIAGTTTPSQVYRNRMPNTPYLFANLQGTYLMPSLIRRADISAYYAINYVHEYYLNYPSVAISSTKNKIPTQFLNHVGLTYSDISRKYNLSLEVRNLFDQAAYDNFNLQKPGRSFHLKLRYFLNKKTNILY